MREKLTCYQCYRPSPKPDADTRRTASVDSRSRKLADDRTVDRRGPPASDRPPDTAHRPPRLRIGVETRANSWGMPGATRGHTTDCGRLKQPDNQELSSLVSNLLGVAAWRMLQALADGETNPATLAALADQRLRATPEQSCDALGISFCPYAMSGVTARDLSASRRF
jgi:hypothetical protein